MHHSKYWKFYIPNKNQLTLHKIEMNQHILHIQMYILSSISQHCSHEGITSKWISIFSSIYISFDSSSLPWSESPSFSSSSSSSLYRWRWQSPPCGELSETERESDTCFHWLTTSDTTGSQMHFFYANEKMPRALILFKLYMRAASVRF